MVRVLAWPRRLAWLYEATQVELHGHYSAERLRSFNDYAAFKSSAIRFIIVLLTTPWPCLAMMLLLEAAPLQPPSQGVTRNVVFWARSDITMFIFTLSFIALCQKAVPELQLSTSKVVAVALVVTSGTQLWGFILSIMVGFPVPFSLVLQSPVWLCLLLGSIAYTSRQFIGDSATGISSLQDWCKVSMLVISLLFVYPIYNYAFSNTSPYGQTALSLLLTVIKIAYKNAIAKCIRVQSDLKAEIVNFHVEISNALFVTFSMQNATSEVTLVVLVFVDFLQACATLIFPASSPASVLRSLGESPAEVKAKYAESVLRLLYLVEFTVLTEFIEFVVPMLYAVYVALVIRLPSREYFPQLAAIDPDHLGPPLLKMLAYSLPELFSLLLLDWMLRRRLRFSPIRQLAFVLETQWRSVQAALVLWVVYVVQTALQHFGSDYSFEFAWLRQPPG